MNYLLSCADLNPINRIITFRDKIKAQLLKLRLPLLFNNNNEDHKASFTLFFCPVHGAGIRFLAEKETPQHVPHGRRPVRHCFPPVPSRLQRLSPFLHSRYIHIISRNIFYHRLFHMVQQKCRFLGFF